MNNCNCTEHLENLNRVWTCPIHGERIITRPDNWNVPIEEIFDDAEFEEVLDRIDKSVKLINELTRKLNRRAA